MKHPFTKMLSLLLAVCLLLPAAGVLASGEPEEEAVTEEELLSLPEESPEPISEEEPAEETAAEPVLDGDSSFTINGVTVTRTSSSIRYNCFTYASEIYKKIWGVGFSSDPSSSNNMLRNLSTEEKRLTAEHVKAYISAAALGSVIRLTGSAYVSSTSESYGHSQILVAKDANGFTVLESNVTADDGTTGSRQKYYSWQGYVSWWQQTANRNYFKYIQWPGAAAYGSTAVQDPPQPLEECTCTTDYAGTYICTVSSSSSLNIRSGHGTSYSAVGSIPSGMLVAVTMGDGSWAHVEYSGISGYASMTYLTRLEPLPEEEQPSDQDGDGWIDQRDAVFYLRQNDPYLAALCLQYSFGHVPG